MELERQIGWLKEHHEAEQQPQDDFSFPKLGTVHRTIDNITDAASKLGHNSGKMNAALFWFYKGNAITDEAAFDAMKEGDLDRALSIWSKLTDTAEVTQHNAAAFSNLATLYLSGVLEGADTGEAILEQGISLKLKFLESDFVKDFKVLATDETFKITRRKLQLLFLNRLQSEIDKNGVTTSNKLLEILNRLEFSAKDDFLEGFARTLIKQIERKIKEAKKKRISNPGTADKTGKALHKKAKRKLTTLKSILGISNMRYSSISDEVSEELLQCGIDFFTKNQDSDVEDWEKVSMNLFLRAESLAMGHVAKHRCQENMGNLQVWMDGEFSASDGPPFNYIPPKNPLNSREKISWAEENPGCFIALIIVATIFLMLYLYSYLVDEKGIF